MTTSTDSSEDNDDVESGVTAHERDEKGISEATRLECYKRDAWSCRRCGSVDELTLHHVIYRSLRGNHKPENLITLCWRCHMRVHAKELIPKRLNDHWIFVDKKRWRYTYLRSTAR